MAFILKIVRFSTKLERPSSVISTYNLLPGFDRNGYTVHRYAVHRSEIKGFSKVHSCDSKTAGYSSLLDLPIQKIKGKGRNSDVVNPYS